jgi:hypothetical protein
MKRRYWMSLTMGNIVPTFKDVLKQVWESLTVYHTIDVRWTRIWIEED